MVGRYVEGEVGEWGRWGTRWRVKGEGDNEDLDTFWK